MLDKNMDWGTLRGRDGNCGALKKLADMCMQLHVDKRLPNYKLFTSEIPPKELFPRPDSLVCVYDYPGQKEQSDPQQMLRVDEYGNGTAQAEWVRHTHDLDYCHVKLNVQPVGMVVKNHRDHNGPLYQQYSREVGEFGTLDLHKILHFLTDWQVGQVVMLGQECVTGWRAGDAVTFPWYMEHATANANTTHERHMLFIAGIRKIR